METLNCLVQYRPSFDSPDSHVFWLRCSDSPQLSLQCSTRFGHPRCVCVEGRVAFGILGMNRRASKSVLVRNTASVDAYFHLGDVTAKTNVSMGLSRRFMHGVQVMYIAR